ncbi:RraA family protein [Agrococcus sp. SGAir0287]|uniref:RraA family protein n=1 Tax=Agrococcus sp. SGAir0287 TaxID=2070347 RepID=UPI0010CD2B9E|nr:RraA family protein [Agrococcus sp. SGAir0287]QCR18448.1 demethylmenaquinone methyltransferase [Agrococcus sp. SGAir0287]
MSIVIGQAPAPLDAELVARLRRCSFATFGHYVEEGFLDPGIRRLTGSGAIVGRAVTVRLTAQDSTMLHHAVSDVEAGDVLVIDTGGDARHAPVGEMIATALAVRGAAGVVVDGVCTDLDEIEALGVVAYARGSSLLTTKLLGVDAGGLHVPVSVGGVTVRSGDVVLADRNGVLVASAAVLAALVDTVLEDDAEEPGLADELRAGRRLGDLTGASGTIRSLQEG